MKRNILITCGGGSGPIYLARKLSRNYNVFLVDSSEYSVANHLGFSFRQISSGDDSNYTSDLKKIVIEFNIDCIVPGADEELEHVASYTLENPKIMAVIPNMNFIRLCLNKKGLMDALSKESISNLSHFSKKKNIRYPVIAKPVYGRGSREVHTIKNVSELNGYLKLYNKNFNDVLVQRKVEGDEYTVSVIVNNLNKMIGVVTKKVLHKRGITRAAVTERNIVIEKVCEKIVEVLNPCGPFNVQLIIEKGEAYIFEINPRLSTTSVLTDRAFGNEVELYIKYFNAHKINNKIKMKEKVFLYRYEENIFV